MKTELVWDVFHSLIASAFEFFCNRQRLALQGLETRTQREGKGFTSYIKALLWQRRKNNAKIGGKKRAPAPDEHIMWDSFLLLVAARAP